MYYTGSPTAGPLPSNEAAGVGPGETQQTAVYLNNNLI